MFDSPQADLPRFIRPPTTEEAYALAQTALNAANSGGKATAVKPTIVILDTNDISSVTVADGIDTIVLVTGAAGPSTVNLPAIPSVGQVVIVVDSVGQAEAYPILISGNGTVMLYDKTQYEIATNYGNATFVYDSSTKWNMI